MKKQFLQLTMVFCALLAWSTNAMAADGDGLAVGTAVWHLAGSSHTLKITKGYAASDCTWTITNVECSDGKTPVTGGDGTTSITEDGTDDSKATIAYAEAASGIYRITVTETSANGCSTLREFYTAIATLDLEVIASASDGAELTTEGDLKKCNDYSTFESTYIVENSITDLVNNTDNGHYNTRYVTAEITMTADLGAGCTVAAAPAASDYGWKFDYALTAGNFVDNFMTFNTVTGVTYTDATATSSTIAVAKGTTKVTLPMTSNIRWGTDGSNADQSIVFTASDLLLDAAGGTDYEDGGENTANAAVGNVSTEQVIYASPATTIITIE